MQTSKAEHSPAVLLLPSHLFFVRSVALPTGLSPGELPSFVELSLEQISPFALNQLYYGYFLPPGASQLLVFAAYRKQLAVYEDEAWMAAELVLPDFACVLGVSHAGPTLAFIQNDDALTAVYWSTANAVPDRVLSRRASPVDHAVSLERAREELRRKLGPLPPSLTTLFLENPKGSFRDRNLLFELAQNGEATKIFGEIARPFFLSMDVRDKAFLQTTRRVQRQNRWLWTGLVGLLAAFLALGVFEVALFAGAKVLSAREARLKNLEPEVARIMEEEELAIRLEELSGERLLPFEMLSFLNQFRPPSVYYTRLSTDGTRSFRIEALTPKSQDVDRFQRLLEGAEALEEVEIINLRRRPDGRSLFTLAGTFREGGLTSDVAQDPGEEGDTVPEAPAEVPEDPDDVPPPEAEAEADLEDLPVVDLPVGDVPVGENRDEEAEAGEEAVALPELPIGDAPVGSPLAEEYVPGEEQPVEEDPLPLPDVSLGEVPAGETDSSELPPVDGGEEEL